MHEERKDEVEAHASDASREAARNVEPRDEADVEGHAIFTTREAAQEASRDAS